MLTNLLQIIHTTIILYTFYQIFTTGLCPPYLVCTQLLLTIIRSIIQKRINSLRTKLQVVLSFILGYTLFTNKFNNLGWLFFIKGIQVHLCLKSIRNSKIFVNQRLKYFAFLFDVLRFYINQFTVLWIVCIIYRFLCDQVHQPIPQTHKLLYQLVVTASTIGYGDVTPKTQMQIIFFTISIPVLCASFVVFINSLVDVYSNTFLSEETNKQISLDVDNKKNQ